MCNTDCSNSKSHIGVLSRKRNTYRLVVALFRSVSRCESFQVRGTSADYDPPIRHAVSYASRPIVDALATHAASPPPQTLQRKFSGDQVALIIK